MGSDTAFRFKQFICNHSRSTMKVGVDAVLLGSWCHVSGCRTILDVGTGCGIIALMCAQRQPDAIISALEIDSDSIEEAAQNFIQSPWYNRLNIIADDWISFSLSTTGKWDLIVSNPPYFKSGILNPETKREIARHQASLSPISLLEYGKNLLTENGRIAIVLPLSRIDVVLEYARHHKFYVIRRLDIKGNPQSPVKRVLVEFSQDINNGDNRSIVCREHEVLVLENNQRVRTIAHKNLVSDFYIR